MSAKQDKSKDDEMMEAEATKMDEVGTPETIHPKTVHGKPDRRFIENREDLQEVHRQREEQGKE